MRVEARAIIRLESSTRPTLCNIISTLFESLRLVVQLVPTSQGIERMNEKAMMATVQTWSEAMDAGMLPHEFMKTVKMATQQIYPDCLEECTLDPFIMKEIIQKSTMTQSRNS